MPAPKVRHTLIDGRRFAKNNPYYRMHYAFKTYAHSYTMPESNKYQDAVVATIRSFVGHTEHTHNPKATVHTVMMKPALARLNKDAWMWSPVELVELHKSTTYAPPESELAKHLTKKNLPAMRRIQKSRINGRMITRALDEKGYGLFLQEYPDIAVLLDYLDENRFKYELICNAMYRKMWRIVESRHSDHLVGHLTYDDPLNFVEADNGEENEDEDEIIWTHVQKVKSTKYPGAVYAPEYDVHLINEPVWSYHYDLNIAVPGDTYQDYVHYEYPKNDVLNSLLVYCFTEAARTMYPDVYRLYRNTIDDGRFSESLAALTSYKQQIIGYMRIHLEELAKSLFVGTSKKVIMHQGKPTLFTKPKVSKALKDWKAMPPSIQDALLYRDEAKTDTILYF